MITVAILGAGIGREHLAAYRELRGAFHVTRVTVVYVWSKWGISARMSRLSLPISLAVY